MIFYKSHATPNIARHWWLFITVILIAACTKRQHDPGKCTNDFISIQNKVNKLFDNEADKGLYYLDSAFKTIPLPSIHDQYRYYGYHFVYYQKLKKDYKQALLYADSMIRTADRGLKKEQYAELVADSRFALGDSYFALKQYTDAYQAYYEGYLIGKSYLKNVSLADYTYRMGMVMYKQKNYKLASSYFRDSYKQSASLPNEFPEFFRRQELLDNIALSYYHAGESDSSLVYFDKALKLIDKNEANFDEKRRLIGAARGVIYGNQADVYIQRGDTLHGIRLLKKSIAINLLPENDFNDAQLTEVKLAKIYLATNKTDSLFNLLNTLKVQLNLVKNADADADYHRLLSNYYLKQKALDKAMDHLIKYNQLKDSINNATSLLISSDVNQQLANYEKQHEIEALSKDNKLQSIFLYAITVVTVLAGIIIFLVLRDWKRSKRDITKVNLLNGQINEQNKELENALTELKNSSQEKDHILRTVAHDLRNPIGGIASLTTIMADDDYNEEQREMINLVKETSYNSLELINEILEATNLASVNLKLEQVEINSLVSNSVELLRFKAAEKGQQILLKTLNRQRELHISREKVWRVISNLISNAIKFSPTGSDIEINVTEADKAVIIAVKDNGIGIPDKLKDKVFNMFTSAQRPGTAGEKSFGLGLSICKQIIEKHGGKIWFEDNPVQGTTFYIQLPLATQGLDEALFQKAGKPTA